MSPRHSNGSGHDPRRPQLQIWDDGGLDTAIGTFSDDGTEWELCVILEPMASDLVRGRLSFRSGEQRYDTAPILVEESAEAVVRRATELPRAMLRQLFLSAKG